MNAATMLDLADIRRFTEHDTHVLWECDAKLPVMLVCDHASKAIPAELGDLGMTTSAQHKLVRDLIKRTAKFD